MAELYLFLAAALSAGVIWYRVVRPMLEGAGIITDEPAVKHYALAAPVVTSHQPDIKPPGTSPDTGTISRDLARPATPYLTERERVLTIAAMKTVDGYAYSANAIYTLVRGNRNEVMGWIREVRGSAAPPPPPELDEDDAYVTPMAGRLTRRSFYPDDPGLEFEPPR